MDLTINEVHTITKLLKRANKFIAAKEKEKLKDGYLEPITRGARGRLRFQKCKNFKVGESSKWVPNNVYQASDDPLGNTSNTKNGPYRCCN